MLRGGAWRDQAVARAAQARCRRRARSCARRSALALWCRRWQHNLLAFVPVEAVDTLARVRALDTRLKALAVFLEAPRLLAVAAAVMRTRCLLGARDLWPERLLVALERGLDGLLAQLVVLGIIEAALAVAPVAVLARREALTVELEASAVAAIARLALLSNRGGRLAALRRGRGLGHEPRGHREEVALRHRKQYLPTRAVSVGKASLVVTQILRAWFVFCQRGNAIHTVFTVQKFGCAVFSSQSDTR